MSETVSTILKEEFEILQKDVIKRHEDTGQVASGRTKASFDNYLTGSYSGVFVGASYSGVLEGGRKSGKVPFEMKQIIMEWAEAKGITFSTTKEFERWANAVAWKIRREGTELFRTGRMHNGKTPDIFETPVAEFETRLNNRISTFYINEIENLI